MEFWERISQQRVKHIVSSYQLAGDSTAEFDSYLKNLLQVYPSPLVELALAETLVDSWLIIPLPRGIDFLGRVHNKLEAWANHLTANTITPEQFSQITGLYPGPVFGFRDLPPNRSTAHPS